MVRSADPAGKFGRKSKSPRDAETGAALAGLGEPSPVLQPVVGRAGHPDPHTLDLHHWRQLPAESLTLEADVERLVVEPLLRFALDAQHNASISKAPRVGPQIVDYVVLQDSRPTCIWTLRACQPFQSGLIWHTPSAPINCPDLLVKSRVRGDLPRSTTY